MLFWRKNRKETAAPLDAGSRPTPSERTVLGPGWHVKGRIYGKGQVVLQSTFEGELDLQGSVRLEGKGKVKGVLRADEVRIGGPVEGRLESSDLVVLDASARIEGDVATPRIVMAAGARLNGHVAMNRQRKL